ncbi:helix-turn-helix domain-containing protein [Chryseobacterium sp.]|uniref:helix-turn-helix domain-containing protein n=1 Tax=Chryseobacterium sp. TaxID=1871047 RepID=UPI0038901F2C
MSKEILNLILKASGKTKKEFADKIKVSVSSVTKWMTGITKPTPNNQVKIRKEFKSEIAKLYK